MVHKDFCPKFSEYTYTLLEGHKKYIVDNDNAFYIDTEMSKEFKWWLKRLKDQKADISVVKGLVKKPRAGVLRKFYAIIVYERRVKCINTI